MISVVSYSDLIVQGEIWYDLPGNLRGLHAACTVILDGCTHLVPTYTNYRGFVFHRYKVVLLLVDPRVRGPAAPDHGVRATARAPSRTPLSQSASALLNVKVCNCGNEVHQNGASADTLLPSSILQQLVHLSSMLHACREWLYRQVSLLSGCLSRGSSTAARVLRQCRA